MTTQGSATPRTALRDALDATFPTQAGDRAPHDYADLLWMALSQRGFAIEAEAVSELRAALWKASDDLLNDQMSDLEHSHLDSRYHAFAQRVRALLAGDKAEAPPEVNDDPDPTGQGQWGPR